MNNILENWVDPLVVVQYYQQIPPGETFPIGIIQIPASSCRPHLISKGGENIRRNEIWIRRNGKISLASREEIFEICADRFKEKHEEIHRTYQDVLLTLQEKHGKELQRLEKEYTEWTGQLEDLCQDLTQKLLSEGKLSKEELKNQISRLFKFYDLEALLKKWNLERW